MLLQVTISQNCSRNVTLSYSYFPPPCDLTQNGFLPQDEFWRIHKTNSFF
jgi:hypothetical protein